MGSSLLQLIELSDRRNLSYVFGQDFETRLIFWVYFNAGGYLHDSLMLRQVNVVLFSVAEEGGGVKAAVWTDGDGDLHDGVLFNK